MSNDIPEGFRDCWTLSLSLHGCRWLSHDGVLTVNVTERITRTAREFVSKEMHRLGRADPADDALFAALLETINIDAIDAATLNKDLNTALIELMDALIGGPNLNAANLAEHTRLFQRLGHSIQGQSGNNDQSSTLGTLPPHLSQAANVRTALLYFLIKGYFADRVTFPSKVPQKEAPKTIGPVSNGPYRPDLDDLAASYTPLLQEKLQTHLSESVEPFALDDPSLLGGLSKRVRRDDIFPGTKNTSHKDTQKYFGKNAPERLRERAIIHFIAARHN
jgi:hypothetical protein